MIRSTIGLLFLGAVGCGDCKGGGGPGGWLVGDDGLMAEVDRDGHLGDGYDLDAPVDLHGIACRGASEAYVVGDHGTVLHTGDGGDSWAAIDLGTPTLLRAVAATQGQAAFIVGEGVFFATSDGETWRSMNVAGPWQAVATTEWGETTLAVGDGRLWRWNGTAVELIGQTGRLVRNVAVRVIDGGTVAVAAGDGLWRSLDRGDSWTPIALPGPVALEDVALAADGAIVAVGAAGTLVRVAPGAPAGMIARIGGGLLRTVLVAADGTGFAAGDHGVVLRSDDRGVTWTPLALGLDRNIRAIDQIGGWPE